MKLLHRVRQYDQFPNKWELSRLLHEIFDLSIMDEEKRWKVDRIGNVWEVFPNDREVKEPRFGFDNYLPAVLLWILLEKELLHVYGRRYPYGRKQAEKAYARLRGETPGEDCLPGNDECETGWCESDGTEWSSFEQKLKTDS